MHSGKTNIFLALCFIAFPAWSQGVTDRGARVLLSTSTGLQDVSFYVYAPPFHAKAIYADTLQAVNQFPEQLMSSAISTTSQEWINYNTLNGKTRGTRKQQGYFDYIRTMNRDSNFFELRAKLNFSLAGAEFTIMKFFFHSQELARPQAGAYVMQRDNGRWYLTSTTNTSEIALMVMRFEEERLLEILRARATGNNLMDTLIALVAPNGAVDFTLLYREFTRWYDTNDTTRLQYFIDQNTW